MLGPSIGEPRVLLFLAYAIFEIACDCFPCRLYFFVVIYLATRLVLGAYRGERFDHEDWCTHPAVLCTWNLDRRSVKEDKPDTIIDSQCCIMCLEYHPMNPAWIAGGNFNGEIILWDLSQNDDLVLASSGIGDDAHREPVSKVHWVKGHSSKRRDYNVSEC
ncbi:WD repeat-containing protein 34 [Plakobranchus ocellatus]|uniref:WD repeat-containing protein 34 n=1 Tax=Plakobranchus ocellatus TaxID=259542 RepID=A0AAV4AYW7_9GAST|nr:WD repeat-containing protein 34 [Plakobranchus ocellatus]